MYTSTDKLTHIFAIQPNNTTLAAFRQPYFINPSLIVVQTSRSRDLIAASSLIRQRPTVNVARKCQKQVKYRKQPIAAIFDYQRPEILPIWPKSDNFWKPTDQYELYSMTSIHNNGQKPPPAAMFQPPEGRLANVPKNLKTQLTSVYTMYEVDSVTSIPDNGWIPPTAHILRIISENYPNLCIHRD